MGFPLPLHHGLQDRPAALATDTNCRAGESMDREEAEEEKNRYIYIYIIYKTELGKKVQNGRGKRGRMGVDVSLLHPHGQFWRVIYY